MRPAKNLPFKESRAVSAPEQRNLKKKKKKVIKSLGYLLFLFTCPRCELNKNLNDYFSIVII
jgi:hypothetical protein